MDGEQRAICPTPTCQADLIAIYRKRESFRQSSSASFGADAGRPRTSIRGVVLRHRWQQVCGVGVSEAARRAEVARPREQLLGECRGSIAPPAGWRSSCIPSPVVRTARTDQRQAGMAGLPLSASKPWFSVLMACLPIDGHHGATDRC